MALPEQQQKAFDHFYSSARNNKVLGSEVDVWRLTDERHRLRLDRLETG